MSGRVLDESNRLANERSESQVDGVMARVKVKSSPCYLIVTKGHLVEQLNLDHKMDSVGSSARDQKC